MIRNGVMKSLAMFGILALAACTSEETTSHAVEEPGIGIVPVDAQQKTGNGILRWVRPIRISLLGTEAEANRPHVLEKVRMLRSITGHDMEVIGEGEGNVILVLETGSPKEAVTRHAGAIKPLYSNDSAMAADLAKAPPLCRAKRGISTADRHEIVYAAGLVPAESDVEARKHCIYSLLTSSMGWNFSMAMQDLGANASISASLSRLLPAIEQTMLKAWYDDRVKPGMTMKDVRPIIDEIKQKSHTPGS